MLNTESVASSTLPGNHRRCQHKIRSCAFPAEGGGGGGGGIHVEEGGPGREGGGGGGGVPPRRQPY